MSERRIKGGIDEVRKVLRNLEDRLHRLERGGAVSGIVSFGDHIIIGGIDVTVVDTGGGHKKIVFTNPSTGSSSTITL